MTVYLIRACESRFDRKDIHRIEADTLRAWAASGPPLDGLPGQSVFPWAQLLCRLAEVPCPDPAPHGFLDDNGSILEFNRGLHYFQARCWDNYDNPLGDVLYGFDENYRAEHPGRTDYLLHPAWDLTPGAGKGPFVPVVKLPGTGSATGDGAIYMVVNARLHQDTDPDATKEPFAGWSMSVVVGGVRIDGVRLPHLCRYLLTLPAPDGPPVLPESPEDMLGVLTRACRTVLALPKGGGQHLRRSILANPSAPDPWQAWSDWLAEHGRPPADIALLDRALRTIGPLVCPGVWDDGPISGVRVTEHLAQVCYRGTGFDRESLPVELILFDDRWAAAYPSLANGILRLAVRWDVLSGDEGPLHEQT